MGYRLGPLWNERLPYHKNLAYLHEVRRVEAATTWFLVHSDQL